MTDRSFYTVGKRVGHVRNPYMFGTISGKVRKGGEIRVLVDWDKQKFTATHCYEDLIFEPQEPSVGVVIPQTPRHQLPAKRRPPLQAEFDLEARPTPVPPQCKTCSGTGIFNRAVCSDCKGTGDAS